MKLTQNKYFRFILISICFILANNCATKQHSSNLTKNNIISKCITKDSIELCVLLNPEKYELNVSIYNHSNETTFLNMPELEYVSKLKDNYDSMHLVVFLSPLKDNSSLEFQFEIGFIEPGQMVDTTYNYFSKLDSLTKRHPDNIRKFNFDIKFIKASKVKTLKKAIDGNFTISNIEFKSLPYMYCRNYDIFIDTALMKKIDAYKDYYNKITDSIIMKREIDSLDNKSR